MFSMRIIHWKSVNKNYIVPLENLERLIAMSFMYGMLGLYALLGSAIAVERLVWSKPPTNDDS